MGRSNNIARILIDRAREARQAINATFELLPVCNLDCKMCFIRTDMETVKKKGGLIPVEKWLDLAKEMQEYGVLFLLLTGGEVFLYPQFRYLYEQLCLMGFSITINTNGTMIDEETVQWLKNYPPKCVSMSLYGASNETYKALCGRPGMFDRVDHAVELMQEAGIEVEFKMLLTPLNVHDMKDCGAYCRRRNINLEMTTYAFPPARNADRGDPIRFLPQEAVEYLFEINRMASSEKEYDDTILAHLKKYASKCNVPGCQKYGFSCTAANTACWINWQGKMTGCGMLNEPYSLPFEVGFEKAWEELKEKSDMTKLCTDCSFCDMRAVCTVCPASSYAETGNIAGRSDYHCQMTKYQLERMIDYAEMHNLKWKDEEV